MDEHFILYGEIINISYQQDLKRIKYKFRDRETTYHIKLYEECDTYNNYVIIRKNINFDNFFKIIYNKEGKIISIDRLELNCNCIII